MPKSAAQRSSLVVEQRSCFFPFMYPMTCATEYFGGIEISMCTWSGIRWPSRILHSYCEAKARNISPIRWRSFPYSAFSDTSA
jgi:hypothetical protein